MNGIQPHRLGGVRFCYSDLFTEEFGVTMFDCSCRGMNDKCFKCDGSGVVGSRVDTLGRTPASLKAPELTAPKKKQKQKMKTKKVPVITMCTACGTRFRDEAASQGHYANCPKRSTLRGRIVPVFAPSGRSSLSANTQGLSIAETFSHPMGSSQDELDGSKDYGTAFREGGRFGSHPSFDSMDDESFS